MSGQNKITGVVLAGGLARRMQRQDKGLVHYHDRPLIEYALQTLASVADEVLVNANRNVERYRQFGFQVVCDLNENFDGPLAGVLAAMIAARHEILLVMPCDSPLIKPVHLQKLLDARREKDADIAVAYDGERLHPVFLAMKKSLQPSLEAYMGRGERKIDRWLQQHDMTQVDFSQEPEVFVNINTLPELKQLQAQRDE